MAKTGSVLDIPKRRRAASNPFSFDVARAKVLLDRGETIAAVRRSTWLDRRTIRRIRDGLLGTDLPAAAFELAKATEDAKLTMAAGLCLDEIIENPAKIRDASLQQLITTAGIALDKREVMAGRPTSRVELLHNLSEDQLDDALEAAHRELGERLKARGRLRLDDVSEAEYTEADQDSR